MNRINDLIDKLCPVGVPHVPLGDLIQINFGTRITKAKDTGTLYPVYGGGGESFRTNTHNREDEWVISRFAMSGDCVRWVSGKFWMLDSGFTFDVALPDLDKEYVGQVLLHMRPTIFATSTKSAQKNIDISGFKRLKIPVPPIDLQREIARILNLFTSMAQEFERELEKELEARHRQYAHYRESLLTLHGQNQDGRVPMGEIGEFIRGRRFTKNDVTEVGIPSIHYGEIYTHYGTATKSTISHVREGLASQLRYASPDDVVIAAVGETVEDVGKAVAWLGSGEVAVHDDCFIFRSPMNPKFVAYYLQTNAFHSEKGKHVARAKVKRLSGGGLAKLTIPIPPPEEQERIVAVLDELDALINDLSVTLSAEIDARCKQFEYYKGKMLTFAELAS
ncbi:restriction endonuclease subunit S [Pseudarthrobacter sp. HLT3-5]|uniref:restriction endonuclease subunit S n=1 Tax=Pseudarthrobacter cellobiosi TaxID=2953654 RepID=UPI00208EF400|nr:restriction endonuclease subunit S [Pseudarthrobacter sp. HLT3-5]MCO4273045.1 restriction endonuclease subunit S [Pseudarthrobacter sp. HLT3-5]